MNSLILFIEVLVIFCALLVCYRLFGKAGAITWVAMATILANVITAKNANIFGLSTAIGTVMFASTFLATDILTEYHSIKDAKTAVYVGSDYLDSDCFVVSAKRVRLCRRSNADSVLNESENQPCINGDVFRFKYRRRVPVQ